MQYNLANTSLIQQWYHSQFQSSITIKPHPISQKHIFFLENQLATGADIHHYSWIPRPQLWCQSGKPK